VCVIVEHSKLYKFDESIPAAFEVARGECEAVDAGESDEIGARSMMLATMLAQGQTDAVFRGRRPERPRGVDARRLGASTSHGRDCGGIADRRLSRAMADDGGIGLRRRRRLAGGRIAAC